MRLFWGQARSPRAAWSGPATPQAHNRNFNGCTPGVERPGDPEDAPGGLGDESGETSVAVTHAAGARWMHEHEHNNRAGPRGRTGPGLVHRPTPGRLQDLRKRRRTGARPRRRERRLWRRRIHRHHGPLRLRQVHDDAHPRRPRRPHLRARLRRRHRHHHPERHRAHQAAPRPHRLRVPVLQPGTHPGCARQHPPAHAPGRKSP